MDARKSKLHAKYSRKCAKQICEYENAQARGTPPLWKVSSASLMCLRERSCNVLASVLE